MGCGSDTKEEDSVTNYASISWENSGHFSGGRLGDSTQQTNGVDTVQRSISIWTAKSNHGLLQSFTAYLDVDTTVSVSYKELQLYYNNLFQAEQVDKEWSYWNFEVNQEPAEVYLILLDSNTLEIRGSILSYR